MRYCPVCGIEVSSPADIRFGEAFCSPPHAAEFVEKIRAARIQAAAALAVQTPEIEGHPPNTVAAGKLGHRDWKHYVKMGACIGAPILALVFLAGGGSAVLGVGGALLPIVAFLACPLAMYFLMRSMARTEQPHDAKDKKGRE